MADNASTARPYAKAIFELAQENKAFAAWGDALNKLAFIAEDEQFSALIHDPKVSHSNVLNLLLELMGKDLPKGGENFLQLLLKNRRTEALPDISTQYAERVARAEASVNAQVFTAHALSAAQRKALEGALEARLGLKVVLEETVDTSLLGGAIVKAGDMVIDGSAKGRLEKLTTALMR